FAIQLTTPRAFFVYVFVLTLVFTLFAIWRVCRRRFELPGASREEFLAYPQTSPEIYAWLPYHREAAGQPAPMGESAAAGDAPPPEGGAAVKPPGGGVAS